MFHCGRFIRISHLPSPYLCVKKMRRSAHPSKSKTTSTKPRKRLKVKDDDDDGGGGGENAESGPENWRDVYANIVEMRADKSAPVDTMGCEKNHDDKAPPKVRYCRYPLGIFDMGD